MYLGLPVRRKSVWLDDGAKSSTDISFARKRSVSKLSLSHLSQQQIQLATHLSQFAKTSGKVVKINVGGQLFQTYQSTLDSVPNTRLSELDETSPFYEEKSESYFIDRNPIIFQSILDYYRDGEMHLPHDICARQIERDLTFWQLNITNLANCCKKYYEDILFEMTSYEALVDEIRSIPKNIYGIHTEKGNLKSNPSFSMKAWQLIDDHTSSTRAKVWHAVYMVLVAVTILVFFTSTLDSCRVPKRDSIYCIGLDMETVNNSQVGQDQIPKIQRLLNTTPHATLQIIELLCLILFTVEFIFRFAVCPGKLLLFKSSSTFIDILYIVPAWIAIFVEIAHEISHRKKHEVALFVALEALMIFRTFRITRFAKHFRGLRILYLAIRNSFHELALLFVFVCFNITIYASLIYCAEILSPDYFDNAYHGVWWALITMTTVGYGDMYPTSWLGYLVASFCAVTGIIMIQMPVPIIVSNFHTYYGLRLPDDDDGESEAPAVEAAEPSLSPAVEASEPSLSPAVEASETSLSPDGLPEDRGETRFQFTVNNLPFIPSNKVGVMNEDDNKEPSLSPDGLPEDREDIRFQFTVNDLPFIPSNKVGVMNEDDNEEPSLSPDGLPEDTEDIRFQFTVNDLP